MNQLPAFDQGVEKCKALSKQGYLYFSCGETENGCYAQLIRETTDDTPDFYSVEMQIPPLPAWADHPEAIECHLDDLFSQLI